MTDVVIRKVMKSRRLFPGMHMEVTKVDDISDDDVSRAQDKLFTLCEAHHFPAPKIEVIEALTNSKQENRHFISTIQVDEVKISSYPTLYTSKNGAKLDALKKAIDCVHWVTSKISEKLSDDAPDQINCKETASKVSKMPTNCVDFHQYALSADTDIYAIGEIYPAQPEDQEAQSKVHDIYADTFNAEQISEAELYGDAPVDEPMQYETSYQAETEAPEVSEPVQYADQEAFAEQAGSPYASSPYSAAQDAAYGAVGGVPDPNAVYGDAYGAADPNEVYGQVYEVHDSSSGYELQDPNSVYELQDSSELSGYQDPSSVYELQDSSELSGYQDSSSVYEFQASSELSGYQDSSSGYGAQDSSELSGHQDSSSGYEVQDSSSLYELQASSELSGYQDSSSVYELQASSELSGYQDSSSVYEAQASSEAYGLEDSSEAYETQESSPVYEAHDSSSVYELYGSSEAYGVEDSSSGYEAQGSSEAYGVQDSSSVYELQGSSEDYGVQDSSSVYELQGSSEAYGVQDSSSVYELQGSSEAYGVQDSSSVYELQGSSEAYGVQDSSGMYELQDSSEAYETPDSNEVYGAQDSSEGYEVSDPNAIYGQVYEVPIQNGGYDQDYEAPIQNEGYDQVYEVPIQNEAYDQVYEVPIQNEAYDQVYEVPTQNEAYDQVYEVPIQSEGYDQPYEVPDPNDTDGSIYEFSGPLESAENSFDTEPPPTDVQHFDEYGNAAGIYDTSANDGSHPQYGAEPYSEEQYAQYAQEASEQGLDPTADPAQYYAASSHMTTAEQYGESMLIQDPMISYEETDHAAEGYAEVAQGSSGAYDEAAYQQIDPATGLYYGSELESAQQGYYDETGGAYAATYATDEPMEPYAEDPATDAYHTELTHQESSETVASTDSAFYDGSYTPQNSGEAADVFAPYEVEDITAQYADYGTGFATGAAVEGEEFVQTHFDQVQEQMLVDGVASMTLENEETGTQYYPETEGMAPEYAAEYYHEAAGAEGYSEGYIPPDHTQGTPPANSAQELHQPLAMEEIDIYQVDQLPSFEPAAPVVTNGTQACPGTDAAAESAQSQVVTARVEPVPANVQCSPSKDAQIPMEEYFVEAMDTQESMGSLETRLQCALVVNINFDGQVTLNLPGPAYQAFMDLEYKHKPNPVKKCEIGQWYIVHHNTEEDRSVKRAVAKDIVGNGNAYLMHYPDEDYLDTVPIHSIYEMENPEEVCRVPPQGVTCDVMSLTEKGVSPHTVEMLIGRWLYQIVYIIPVDTSGPVPKVRLIHATGELLEV